MSLKIKVSKIERDLLLITTIILLFTSSAYGQQRYYKKVSPERFAIKSNLLYAGATFTPNLGFEFVVGPHSTIELSGSYSWRGRTAAASDNHKQWVHIIARPEYRWWFCQRYDGHFLGTNLIYTRYNISGLSIPLLFEDDKRYDGYAIGAGIDYGYDWRVAKRWNLEFNMALGYLYMDYDKYTCAKCDRVSIRNNKHYFGPTRIGISLMFLFK